MKGWTLVLLVATTGCAGATFQPMHRERIGADVLYVGMYEAGFAVSCSSCRVEYGPADDLRRDVVQGSWAGSVPLGTLRDGDRVRVELHVTPIGEAVVVAAAISMGGRTVASGKSEKPGERVTVRARVGPG
jgi:hypothetical protein